MSILLFVGQSIVYNVWYLNSRSCTSFWENVSGNGFILEEPPPKYCDGEEAPVEGKTFGGDILMNVYTSVLQLCLPSLLSCLSSALSPSLPPFFLSFCIWTKYRGATLDPTRATINHSWKDLGLMGSTTCKTSPLPVVLLLWHLCLYFLNFLSLLNPLLFLKFHKNWPN